MSGMYTEEGTEKGTEKGCRKRISCRMVSISNCDFYITNSETTYLVETYRTGYQNSEKVITINNEEPTKCIFASPKQEEDVLSVQVEADLCFVTDTEPPSAKYTPDETDDLCKGAYSLYKNEALIDTIIKCTDKEFKVHRVILASRSPVFRAMLESDMKEKQSGVVEVSDITPEAMSDLVAYLYTGTAPNLTTLANELLEAAEKYQLPRLLTICENELGDNIKEATVIGTLILADLHGRVCLKKACLEYIRSNSAKVFQTSEWANFKEHKDQYAQLYVEVLEYTLSISP